MRSKIVKTIAEGDDLKCLI